MNWTEEQYDEFLRKQGKTPEPPVKKSKYGNQKTWQDGIPFDSRKEANHQAELEILLRAGEIKGYCMQPVFLLVKGDGPANRAETYRADFIIFNADGTYEIVDDKGLETDVFNIKRKQFRERFPQLNLEVRKT